MVIQLGPMAETDVGAILTTRVVGFALVPLEHVAVVVVVELLHVGLKPPGALVGAIADPDPGLHVAVLDQILYFSVKKLRSLTNDLTPNWLKFDT